MQIFPQTVIRAVSFDPSATLSSWVSVPPSTSLVGLIMPPTWTAATLGFDGAISELSPGTAPGTPIRQMHDESGIIALAVTQNTGMYLVRPRFTGLRWLRARSSVAQLDYREVSLIFAPTL